MKSNPQAQTCGTWRRASPPPLPGATLHPRGSGAFKSVCPWGCNQKGQPFLNTQRWAPSTPRVWSSSLQVQLSSRKVKVSCFQEVPLGCEPGEVGGGKGKGRRGGVPCGAVGSAKMVSGWKRGGWVTSSLLADLPGGGLAGWGKATKFSVAIRSKSCERPWECRCSREL